MGDPHVGAPLSQRRAIRKSATGPTRNYATASTTERDVENSIFPDPRSRRLPPASLNVATLAARVLGSFDSSRFDIRAEHLI